MSDLKAAALVLVVIYAIALPTIYLLAWVGW